MGRQHNYLHIQSPDGACRVISFQMSVPIKVIDGELSETILHTVLKLQLDRAGFQTEEASTTTPTVSASPTQTQ